MRVFFLCCGRLPDVGKEFMKTGGTRRLFLAVGLVQMVRTTSKGSVGQQMLDLK
jgi:hypothetical protein